MSESICATICGPAFSLLLYENTRCEYDQEGFLLGEVVTTEKRTITDNDQEIVKIEHVVHITSIIPCPRMALFYDNIGRIDTGKIENFLGDQMSRVVAWYKFKHISSFKLTLRERVIFKQLASFFSTKAPEHFLCLLTNQTENDSGATHLFSQTFIRYHNSRFQPTPMHIINLNDPHDRYKESKCSETFKNIVDKLNVDTQKLEGYTIVNKIENALENHLTGLITELSVAERRMYDLEQEVSQLQKKHDMHKFGDFVCFENEKSEEENKQEDEPAPAFIAEIPKAKRGRSKKKTGAIQAPKSPTFERHTQNKSYAQAIQKK